MKKVGLILSLLTFASATLFGAGYGQNYNNTRCSPNLPPVNFKPILPNPNVLPNNPMTLFMDWYNASGNSPEYQVMVLSTSSGGRAASCSVWLENVTGRGFIFQSPPSVQQTVDIQNNQQVALLFCIRTQQTDYTSRYGFKELHRFCLIKVEWPMCL